MGPGADFGSKVNRDPLLLDRILRAGPEFLKEQRRIADAANPPHDRAWLGITMKAAPQRLRDPDTGKKLAAIEVLSVFPLSGAASAGLRPGDQIAGLDGQPLEGESGFPVLFKFRETVADKLPGDSLRLRVFREGAFLDMTVRLKSPPKTRANPRPHPQWTGRGEQDSLLSDALAVKNLGPEFARTLREMGQRSREVISGRVRGEDYNPFRLSEVNYVMQNPLDLPLVAYRISDSLHDSFNEERTRFPELLLAGMEELDWKPLSGESPVRPDEEGFLHRLVRAIKTAVDTRKEVLASLSPDEVDRLYERGSAMLRRDPEINEEEKTDEEKKAEAERVLEFLNTALRLDLARLVSAAVDVSRVLDVDSLASLKNEFSAPHSYPPGWNVEERENLKVIRTPVGRILIGGPGNNIFREDAVVILDTGGNDIYLNSAGAGNLEHPFSVVIDLAGDDLYQAPGDFAQGAALLGGGFLIDLEGDDRYLGRNLAQGTGVMGVGLLADLAGNDVYSLRVTGQGAGFLGIGILAEGGGRDRYHGDLFVQGFGFIKGFGALLDRSGSDEYFAGGLYPDDREPGKAYQSLSQGFGYGLRPWDTPAGASGGIGVLADAAGNDTYVAGYFAQGAAYWYALGLLVDKRGHDRYISGRYSQGAGVHLAGGILLDQAGDDNYLADFGVAQGCGHDFATGILLDNGGNDRYTGGVIVQGAGNGNGIGILNDNGGNDEYLTRGQGQGRGEYEAFRGLGSFGFLFDTGGGRDVYSPGKKNNEMVFKTQWGILADTD